MRKHNVWLEQSGSMCDISTCLEELAALGLAPSRRLVGGWWGHMRLCLLSSLVAMLVVSLVLVCWWLCEEEELLGVVM